MPGTTLPSSTGPGPARTPGRRTSRRRARRRRRIYVLCTVTAGGLCAAALLGAAGEWSDRDGAQASSASRKPSATATGQSPTRAADATRRAGGRPGPSATTSAKDTKDGKGTEGPADGTSPGAGPSTGNGVFHTARASGRVAGTGTIRRYEVQVEEGAGIAPDEAAREIAGILADRRGWTADGHDAFQLVSQGPVDFVVKIATPGTVDRICGAAGLHTRGEVNCDVGSQVVVNLKRWNLGSPQFDGPLHEYRALIVNHEVGHRIGHGHEGCPGPGRPAPAMMQQIDGLHGCVANAWPYDSQGHYLGGPAVP
ncbi:DUF3152 domain-containing protein [Streptomyces mexicanus]|uniref:DUF3152 domain-containing protein n=1 Tax=Streptomyces mexicanus TaxID=178566 RepID=UPI0031EDF5AE